MGGTIKYMEDSEVFKTEKPYRWDGPPIPGFKSSNLVQTPLPMALTDLRTVPHFKPTIDSNGFCFVEHKSKELPALVDESNSQPYGDEMAELVKELTGAETVFVVNTRLRSVDKSHNKAPVNIEAHNDVAAPDGWPRVRPHLSQEERDLVLSGKYRVRIFNAWRPMVNNAEDMPLAVLDPNSITDINDVINVDICSPLAAANLAYFRYSPSHRWYWLSNMTPDEVVVFTQFDTHPPNGKFNHVGHGAFQNDEARPDCPPRQSVEARFIALEPAPYHKDKPFGDLEKVETREQPWKPYVKASDNSVPPPADPNNRKMVFGYVMPAKSDAEPAVQPPAVKVN